jgi:pSer/pThr/pTyr-binding forkhead associated (FHA) protein
VLPQVQTKMIRINKGITKRNFFFFLFLSFFFLLLSMQNLNTQITTGLSLELFHQQTKTSFDLPANSSTILVGKPHNQIVPAIDVSNLPDEDIVSRNHAQIHIDKNTYFIEDLGSSNGTYLNKVKLEPGKLYPLKLGDKINLGQDKKVTFIFQEKQIIASSSTNKAISSKTVLQPQRLEKEKTSVDRTSKVVGLASLFSAVVLLAANTQIGIFVRIPSLLLCVAGIVILLQRRFNRNWGWVLIGLGIAVMLFTGNVFLSVNFLAILASTALFIAGYQLFTTGKVWKYSLREIKGLLKK